MYNSKKKLFSDKVTLLHWSKLDSCYQLLVEIANSLEKDVESWKERIHGAVCVAFEQACPHEIPRQILVYTKGYQGEKIY